MPCRCEMCCPVDPHPRQTRAFALACEARELLRWPLHARRDYLEGVGRRRGQGARGALEAAMEVVWEEKKNEQAAPERQDA